MNINFKKICLSTVLFILGVVVLGGIILSMLAVATSGRWALHALMGMIPIWVVISVIFLPIIYNLNRKKRMVLSGLVAITIPNF